jgi:hypothetical protein
MADGYALSTDSSKALHNGMHIYLFFESIDKYQNSHTTIPNLIPNVTLQFYKTQDLDEILSSREDD